MKEKAEEVGQAIIKSLGELQSGYAGGDLNATHLDACYESLRNNYDNKFGGFGKHPKFPTCHTLSFLLRYYQRSGKEDALAMVQHTLKSIRLGGIYDQIGYGVHRYATDEKWLVPHFEKMLYDQALFTIAQLESISLPRTSSTNAVAETPLNMSAVNSPQIKEAFSRPKMLTARARKENFIYGQTKNL